MQTYVITNTANHPVIIDYAIPMDKRSKEYRDSSPRGRFGSVQVNAGAECEVDRDVLGLVRDKVERYVASGVFHIRPGTIKVDAPVVPDKPDFAAEKKAEARRKLAEMLAHNVPAEA